MEKLEPQISGWARRVRSLEFVRVLERELAPQWRRELVAIALLVCVFVVTFFQAQRSPGGSDDCAYFESAAGMESGGPHHRQRFALLGATWLSQAAFGYTSLAYYAVPFVFSLGLVLVSYYAARTLVNRALASMAALMVLALPTILVQGTWLLADIPSMFWIVLGVVLLLRAFMTPEGTWPLKRALGSGVCFYLAVATKESTVLLLPGLGFFPWALGSKRALRILLVAAGATVTLELCELVTMWAVFGDVLYRLHAVQVGQMTFMEKAARTSLDLPQDITWGSLATRFIGDVANNTWFNGWRFLGLGYWDWLVTSLPFGLTVAVLRKDRLLLGFFGFVFWSYLSVSLAPSSLNPLIPALVTQTRYFLVVLLWLPLLALAGWSRLWTWPHERWLRLKLASAVGVAALSCAAYGTARNYLDHSGATIRNGATQLADLYDAVMAFASRGANVERVVGPKTLRAAKFAWPEHSFEILWRSDELEGRRRLVRHDFVIATEPMALQAPPDLLWRRLGGGDRHRYYYLETLGGAHFGGSFGLVAAKPVALMRHPGGAKLGIIVKLDAHRVKPTPLRVVLYPAGKTPVVLATLEWQHQNRAFTLDTTTQTFGTSGVQAVSVEFDVEGSGRFFMEKPKFQVTAADSQKNEP